MQSVSGAETLILEGNPRRAWPKWANVSIAFAALLVVAILIWQAVMAHGVPDPTQPQESFSSAFLSIAVLVFREGLECILVLSAIMASMIGRESAHRRPVIAGAGVGFGATVITWFVAVGILSSLTESVSALNLQAATGLLAVVVLLVVMNWFFHKVYWGGWICLHNRQKKKLLQDAGQQLITTRRLVLGLLLLGFTSFYREGFEVVLFLQSYRLKLGENVVLLGALFGAVLTGIVAILTFVAHRRLPYRRMLVLTGIMLGAVLLVMVGEQAQEMQLAHWIPTTTLPILEKFVPGWAGLWFGFSPTIETLAAQAVAAALVIGCYFAARRSFKTPAPNCIAKVGTDCTSCE
ncbi:MAG: high-affinity iron transporter [Chthoniobacter sp.]|jgi:high-affinity iron transporter|nr:high-affinity iron transporter [Chthoniobacter sp.]